MDGLALLCALHADGPQSLRRLRRSGCPSLEAVTTLDPDRLADLLASTPASAQRFRREAELLLARLGGASTSARASELLETEDAPRASELADGARAPGADAGPHVAQAAPATHAAHAQQAPQVRAGAAGAAGAAGGPRPWDPVTARWRELDALDDAEAAAEPIVEESSAPAPHLSPRTPLSALAELARDSHDALLAAGIVDLEALAHCDPLELAEATGLDYSNAARWSALARRALPAGLERFSRAEHPGAKSAPLVDLGPYELRPTPRAAPSGALAQDARSTARAAAVERFEETAGGPFA
jgi:hypothetical protein